MPVPPVSSFDTQCRNLLLLRQPDIRRTGDDRYACRLLAASAAALADFCVVSLLQEGTLRNLHRSRPSSTN